MSQIVVQRAVSFPATGTNRTRGQAQQELLEYVGGEDRGNAQRRAGLVWDASVREFNTVAWVFNRVIDDITLDSTMRDNLAAGNVTRDTGSGTGFILDTGTSIDYWFEERVKSGNIILKRNKTTLFVTLVGDGSVDQPVVTAPATSNPDATHVALYGTAAGGKFPNGSEIGETTTAIGDVEDTRVGRNPAIPTGVLYNPHDYALSADFRTPIVAEMMDADNHRRDQLRYIPWQQWTRGFYSSSTTTNYPGYYTVRNVHETGQVSYWPRPGGNQQWPVVRHHYHRRILIQTSSGGTLNVPQEVDEAIFQLALAKIQLMVKGREFARDFIRLGASIRQDVEWQWRDYSEDGK